MKGVSHYKYLGILIDSNVNFNEHIGRLYSKLSSRLGALHTMRKHLTAYQYAANKAYNATLLPLLDYCDVSWNSTGETATGSPTHKKRDMHTTL